MKVKQLLEALSKVNEPDVQVGFFSRHFHGSLKDVVTHAEAVEQVCVCDLLHEGKLVRVLCLNPSLTALDGLVKQIPIINQIENAPSALVSAEAREAIAKELEALASLVRARS
jgi:hypothetical protein